MDQDDAMAARGADAGHNGSERNPDAPAAAAGPVDEAGDTEEEETTDEEESGEGDDSDDYEDEGDDVDIAEEEGARVAVEQVRRNGMFMRLLNRLVHGRDDDEDVEEDIEEALDEEPGAAAADTAEGLLPAHPKLRGTAFVLDMSAAVGRTAAVKRIGTNLHTLIQARKRNLTGAEGLSRGQRVTCAQNYLPTRVTETLAEFDQHVFCGTYSQDGSMFMSACQDAMLRLYDTRNLNFELKMEVQARDVGWAVVDTCYSPDQHFLIYSSWSNYIHLVTLDGDRHEALDLLPGQRAHICPFSIRFSQDSREIICGLNNKYVFIYDCVRDQRSLALSAHDDDVNAVAFLDESSNILASGSDDLLCKVWDRRILRERNPRPVGIMRGHLDGITYIDGRGDGRYFISQSKDQSIKLWDVRRMGNEATEAPRIHRMDYRFDDDRAGGLLHRPRALRRRVQGDLSLMTYTGSHSVSRTLIRARFSPVHTTGQRYIYSGSADGRLAIYDALTGETVATVPCHDGIVRDASWHPFRPHVVTSAWDGMVKRSAHALPHVMSSNECRRMVES